MKGCATPARTSSLIVARPRSRAGVAQPFAKSDFGKLFTTLYIVVAVGLFVVLVSFLADGMLSPSRRSRKQHGQERLEDEHARD